MAAQLRGGLAHAKTRSLLPEPHHHGGTTGPPSAVSARRSSDGFLVWLRRRSASPSSQRRCLRRHARLREEGLVRHNLARRTTRSASVSYRDRYRTGPYRHVQEEVGLKAAEADGAMALAGHIAEGMVELD